VLGELFKQNVLVKLLRGDAGRYDLIVSMVGPKVGDRLLQLGGGDGRLLGALGAKTGLSGTLVAVESGPATAAKVQEEATKAGVLAEVVTATDAPPYEPGSFDIVVIPFPADEAVGLSQHLRDAFRVLRDGGRVIIVNRAGRGHTRQSAEASGGPTPPMVSALQEHGFRAARLLAERDGLRFYEGVKK
jgi:ubiquinone/menaquinone biosynthesis C-methylase UbiE